MWKCREKVLPLLMRVIKFKVFGQNYIGGIREFNKEFTQIFQRLMTGKSRKAATTSDLEVEIFHHLAVLKTNFDACLDGAVFKSLLY